MPRKLTTDFSESGLDAATEERAKEQLNETDEKRSVESLDLVNWVQGNDEIPSFTDPMYIMAFLRTSKFCQRESRNRIQNYWKSRNHRIMKLMNNVDPASPAVLDILRGPHSVYLPLPGYDTEGRKVILAHWEQLDVSGKSYTFEDWFRAITVIFDTLCFLDEKTMVNGITFLMDASGVAFKHLTFFGFNNSRYQFQVMQGGYPIRIKQVHYINNNAVIGFFFNAVKTVLSSKLAQRIKLHGYNMDPVYEDIGLDNLPDEYLPEDYVSTSVGSESDIMNKFINEKILKPENLQFLRGLYNCNCETKSITQEMTQLEQEVEDPFVTAQQEDEGVPV